MHAAIRVQALKLADQRLADHPELLAGMLALLEDPHPRVRLQLALSLGASQAPEARNGLARLAHFTGSDSWLSVAVLSSAGDSAADVLSSVLNTASLDNLPIDLYRALSSIVGARRDPVQIGAVLSSLGQLPTTMLAAQLACLEGLDDGLRRGKPSPVESPRGVAGLRQLLTHDYPRVRERAVAVAGLMRLQQVPEMVAILHTAQKTALDTSLPLVRRQQAVALLAVAPLAQLQTVADQLLDSRQPIELQLAIVEALKTSDYVEAGPILLRDFRAGTPRRQAAVVDAIFARQDRLPALLDAMEQGDEMLASSVSMMPEDLEKQVSPPDLANLLAFLRNAFGQHSPPIATLFDEDIAFPALLDEGTGTASIERRDCFSGTAALAVTTPQRFSASIPGWQYRVTENPEPGEYRYLRFAWKQTGGDGIMLELADAHNWPLSSQSRLRYFAGRNTTAWRAVEVAPQLPTEWTEVTRDLWRDFGDITLTGIAPTTMGGIGLFDRIQLLRTLDE